MANPKENRGIFTHDSLQAYLSKEPKLAVEPLGEGLWTVSDGLLRTIFAEGAEGVIAFDTFGTPGAARAYAKAIAEVIPSKPVKTVIYSHDHLDHAGFAADLAPKADIIADEMTARVIELRGAEGQLPPTRTVSGGKNSLEIDGVRFDLLNPGPTHGAGNLAAYFADHKLLFMSDTILPNARYGLLPDYHIANLARFMRGFLELEFETFVPGRYGVTDKAAIERGADYIEAIQETCQQAFVQGVPVWILSEITGYVKQKLREKFGDLDGFEEHVGLTAFRIVHHYLMGGWGLEDTPEPGIVLA